ncbi:MAG: IS66 family transposase [Phycisphaerae bacterium]|nr:IS66 family transposase [Phycisphaerae bacterium]
MDVRINRNERIRVLLAAALDGTLSDAQAEELVAFDPDLVKLAILAAVKRIAEQNERIAEQKDCIAELNAKLDGPPKVDPSTPSGQRPIYTKPPSPKRKGKPGAKKGHVGTRRPTPQRIDEHKEHRLDRCPCCGGKLQRCNRKRTRTIEDILEDLRTVVTEHTIYRDYCPKCRKHVEPTVPDALPNATIGHRTVALSAYLHYGVGVSISQVQDLLGGQFQTRLSAGGLVAAWQRMAVIFEPWYVQIAEQARLSAVLHADETGWRMNGQTWWLWCFANRTTCYYLIDPSRGGPALDKFFVEAFDGVLITDFWPAYNAFATERQCCLVHLLRELEKVDEHNHSAEWQAFAKTLRRLVRDGIRLRKRADFSPEKYASRIVRIDRRLRAMAEAEYADADASRLAKRLWRHCDELFTFLDYPEVTFDNNLAERMIRPAVILRKVSQSNRSEKGAAVQAVLMSVYRTLKLRGHDPLATITSTLRTHLTTGQLPSLPVPSVADG